MRSARSRPEGDPWYARRPAITPALHRIAAPLGPGHRAGSTGRASAAGSRQRLASEAEEDGLLVSISDRAPIGLRSGSDRVVGLAGSRDERDVGVALAGDASLVLLVLVGAASSGRRRARCGAARDLRGGRARQASTRAPPLRSSPCDSLRRARAIRAL
ncbi:hypothetical protein WMF37_39230 [Sorangium sp. So ce291]|uniref:hypothetical protein n=1 Tax=Sorangium sp. So ce291 TaxID=3133294 RepID=UPI003F623F6D